MRGYDNAASTSTEMSDHGLLLELASVGMMTEALTDELQEPLLGALQCAASLAKVPQSPERVVQYMRAMQEALGRMQRTLRSLQRSGSGLLRPEPLSIRELAEDCVRRTTAAGVANGARVVLQLVTRRARVYVDRADAERALFHIVSVWLRRAADGATVVLETRTRDQLLGFHVRQRDSVVFSPRPFEAIDTTISLAATRRLAERNGGSLEIRGHRAEGMVLWLPLDSPAP